MRTLLVLTCIVAVALAADADLNDKDWVAYKKRGQLTFDNPAEELSRYKYWKQYQNVIGQLNNRKGRQTRTLSDGSDAPPLTVEGTLRSIGGLLQQIPGLVSSLHGRATRSVDNEDDNTPTARSISHFIDQMNGLVLSLHGRKTRALEDEEPQDESNATKTASLEPALRSISNAIEQVHGLILSLHGRKTRTVQEIAKKLPSEDEALRSLGGLVKQLPGLVSSLHGRATRTLDEKTGQANENAPTLRSISHVLDQIHKAVLDLHGRRTRSAGQGIDEEEARSFGSQIKGLYKDLHGRATRSDDAKDEAITRSFISQIKGLYLDLHGRATRSLDDKTPAPESRGLTHFLDQMKGLYLSLHGRQTRSLDNGDNEDYEQTRGLSHFMNQMHGLYLDLHGRRTRSLDDDTDSNTTDESRGISHFLNQMHGLYLDLHGRQTRSLEEDLSNPENRGLSHFMDQMHGLYLDLHGRKTRSLSNHINSNTSLPASIDWREKNAVSPVQDQGACGSGWAFAAAGALEAQVAIKTGKLAPLSAQSLIDCSKVEKPCEGGSPVWATAKPVQTLAAYPYVGLTGTCKTGETAAKSTQFVPIESGNEKDLQDAIATIGPVTVAIDASDPVLQTYTKGIYAPKNCSTTKLSHVALAVGYGQEDGQDYWLIKNSWGAEWGEKGYLKLVKNGQNTCGIASHAGYLLA